MYPCIPCEHTLLGTSFLESVLVMFVVIVAAMIAPQNCCAIDRVGLRQHHELDAEDGGDSSSSSSSSSSEASSGAEHSRPLHTVGKRNWGFSWRPKKRPATTPYDSDGSSSKGELFK